MSGNSYTKAVHNETGLFGSWPPIADVKLGDIFELRNGVPRYLSNIQLDPWNITFTPAPGSNPDGTTPVGTEWVSQSSDGVAYEVRLDAETPPGMVFQALGKADLGIGITMDAQSAYLLSLDGVSATKIENLIALNSALKGAWLRWRDGWNSKWIVATAVWSAEAAAAVMSDSERSEFNFELDGEVADLGVGDPLAKLGTKFKLTGNHSGADNFNVTHRSTPLFEACRVGFLGGPRPAFEGGEGEFPDFVLISPEDDLGELEVVDE